MEVDGRDVNGMDGRRAGKGQGIRHDVVFALDVADIRGKFRNEGKMSGLSWRARGSTGIGEWFVVSKNDKPPALQVMAEVFYC